MQDSYSSFKVSFKTYSGEDINGDINVIDDEKLNFASLKKTNYSL